MLQPTAWQWLLWPWRASTILCSECVDPQTSCAKHVTHRMQCVFLWKLHWLCARWAFVYLERKLSCVGTAPFFYSKISQIEFTILLRNIQALSDVLHIHQYVLIKKCYKQKHLFLWQNKANSVDPRTISISGASLLRKRDWTISRATDNVFVGCRSFVSPALHTQTDAHALHMRFFPQRRSKVKNKLFWVPLLNVHQTYELILTSSLLSLGP